MAFWCVDFFRVVFYSFLITFASCHPGLPRDATALAARDWTHDSHNWHKVMQTLESTDSRIGIPWAALPNPQLNMPFILEMAPYDLTIVPNVESGSLENELIEVDERQLMVFTARRGAKSIQRSERPERSLQSVLVDMRAQGVKVAVSKSRLQTAPLRLWNEDTKLATTVEESEVGDRFRDQFWVKNLFYPWVLPDKLKSPSKEASPITGGGSSEPNPVREETAPCKTGDQSIPFNKPSAKMMEGFGVHRKPEQALQPLAQNDGSNAPRPSLPETPSETQGQPSPTIRYTNGTEASP